MADPRFYNNRGPFTLAAICARVGVDVPVNAAPDSFIADVASLVGAGPQHLAFYSGANAAAQFAHSKAGFCLTSQADAARLTSPGAIIIAVPSVQHAFADIAALFHPDHAQTAWPQSAAIDPSARLGRNVLLGHGVVIGPNAEIGDDVSVGPNSVIGPGVAVGRGCQIGANVTISHAYIGDDVFILPGAQIGQPGFGFASDRRGHMRMPQLGRVIIQDRVEIGACTTVDRGALGDTVIGEGTKIDNLVQIGHNNHLGRHDMIVGQAGLAGSCELGDFVVLGGQVGFADHVRVGDGARFAARSGAAPGDYAGGQDWGGTPAVPAREWMRQVAAVVLLAKRRKKSDD